MKVIDIVVFIFPFERKIILCVCVCSYVPHAVAGITNEN